MGNGLVLVDGEDAVKALKRFKGIAKQDLLIADSLPSAETLRHQAEARRRVYEKLIELTGLEGVEGAYRYATDEYLRLPHPGLKDAELPEVKGYEKAYELALQAFGLHPRAMLALRVARRGTRMNQARTAESVS